MPTTITTYKMLEYIDQTLSTLKLPRKTIGFNVTQIGKMPWAQLLTFL
jgi:hypothetical protein